MDTPTAPAIDLSVVTSGLEPGADLRMLIAAFYENELANTNADECFASPRPSASSRFAIKAGDRTLWVPDVIAMDGHPTHPLINLYSDTAQYANVQLQNEFRWARAAQACGIPEDVAKDAVSRVLEAIASHVDPTREWLVAPDMSGFLTMAIVRPLADGIEKEPELIGYVEREGKVGAMFGAAVPEGLHAAYFAWSQRLLAKPLR